MGRVGDSVAGAIEGETLGLKGFLPGGTALPRNRGNEGRGRAMVGSQQLPPEEGRGERGEVLGRGETLRWSVHLGIGRVKDVCAPAQYENPNLRQGGRRDGRKMQVPCEREVGG